MRNYAKFGTRGTVKLHFYDSTPNGMMSVPFFDEFETLRIKAALRVSVLARETGLSRDTIDRIKKHKNSSIETLVSVINAMNKLYYEKEGTPLDPGILITERTRYGEGK